MESRTRWYASPQITRTFLNALKGGVSKRVFTAKSERGFLITSTREDSISGRYIEKISGKRLVPDPFGGTLELPFVTFETIPFRLSSVFPQIELIDAPRNAKRLFVGISGVVENTFSVEPVQWNVADVLEAMEGFVQNLSIEEAHFVGVPVTEKLVSDVVFYGSGDIRAAALKEMKGKANRLGTTKGVFAFRNREYRFEVSGLAGVKLKRTPDDRLLVEFRSLAGKIGTTGSRALERRSTNAD